MKKSYFLVILLMLIAMPSLVLAAGNSGNPEHKITTCGSITNCKVTITKQGVIYGYGHTLRVEEAPGGFCANLSNYGIADHSITDKTVCNATANRKWFSYSLIYVDDSTEPLNLAASTYTDSALSESWVDGGFAYNDVYDSSLTGVLATNTTNGFNLYDSTIVGGSKNENLTSNTSVVMNGGTIYRLVGGNTAYATGTTEFNANLTGNISVDYEKGVIVSSVGIVGGNQLTYSDYSEDVYATANISGNIDITIGRENIVTLEDTLYAKSYLQNNEGTSTIGGKSTINLSSRMTIHDSIFVQKADVLNVINRSDVEIGNTFPAETINVGNDCQLQISNQVTIPTTYKINSEVFGTVFNDNDTDVTVAIDGSEKTVIADTALVTVKDNDTNTTTMVNGAIASTEPIVLTKTNLTSGDVYKKMIALLPKGYEKVELFDLSLGEADPSGVLDVYLVLGSKYANKEVKVTHLPSGATEPEVFKTTVNANGVAKVSVTSLSPFLVSIASSNPQTYDGITNVVIIGIISLIVLITCLVSFKQKKSFN